MIEPPRRSIIPGRKLLSVRNAVGADTDRLAAVRAYSVDDGRDRRLIAAADHDFDAVGGEQTADGRADAARAAGDQGDLAGQVGIGRNVVLGPLHQTYLLI
jgi:hypothetical protein